MNNIRRSLTANTSKISSTNVDLPSILMHEFINMLGNYIWSVTKTSASKQNSVRAS